MNNTKTATNTTHNRSTSKMKSVMPSMMHVRALTRVKLRVAGGTMTAWYDVMRKEWVREVRND